MLRPYRFVPRRLDASTLFLATCLSASCHHLQRAFWHRLSPGGSRTAPTGSLLRRLDAWAQHAAPLPCVLPLASLPLVSNSKLSIQNSTLESKSPHRQPGRGDSWCHLDSRHSRDCRLWRLGLLPPTGALTGEPGPALPGRRAQEWIRKPGCAASHQPAVRWASVWLARLRQSRYTSQCNRGAGALSSHPAPAFAPAKDGRRFRWRIVGLWTSPFGRTGYNAGYRATGLDSEG